MATKDIALGILIGGAVSSTLGRAVNEVGTKLDALKKRAGEARVWQNTIGETQRLQREFRDLHAAGDRAADKVRVKIERNTRALREAGFEVDRLDRSYQRLGRTARGPELRARGTALVADGRDGLRNTIGDTTKFVAAAAVPTAISAGYEAIIRDIAIKAGAARTDKEREMSSGIAASAQQSGIGRNVLADAVNQMVSAGMDLDRALSFAPLVGKFSVSQGADPKETARMIQALEQNAKIADPAKMAQALETIAFQGKEGSFESSDMARWFPVLLADMQKLGIVGNSSVEQLGALLQVQMKTAGSADEAANNTKNWFSKIGSGETAGNYAKAGIDYEAKMREAIGKGWSTMEASFVLARAYIEQADPEKAKQLAAAAQQFNSESDPAKREAQMRAFAETMKTGDLFNDMQVKAALTAYMQNADLYQRLKSEGAKATGEIEKDLADRRDSSKQKWAEVGQAWDEAMRRIGDALKPVTDSVADLAASAGTSVGKLAAESPKATVAIGGVLASILAFRTGRAVWKIGKGVSDIARGTAVAAGVGRTAEAAATAAKVAPAAAKPSGVLSASGRFLKGAAPKLGKIGAVAGVLALVGTAGMASAEAAERPGNKADKAKAIAGIGAGLAGELAGGAAGRAIGAVAGTAIAGPIGTVVGGLLGGMLGSYLGGKASTALADRALSDKKPEAAPQAGAPVLPAGAQEALGTAQAAANAPPAPQLQFDQRFEFAPQIAVTVQGDVKDPRQLAEALMPHLRRQFDEYAAQQRRAAMSDGSHV
ncbi:phage tail tape measure protein [Ralstonia sp. TCR112]|uniref:phage tail tape measure protein n=1 Tax=Ralstonia sp. TCR112 TaxID=2601730 RepID=UPI0011BF00D3|nr:phage tail tape measure protein [Ralstonia sp. TCR112]TXD63516.1 phage tail tape measure protein [Ralstonia sp. TCR112]